MRLSITLLSLLFFQLVSAQESGEQEDLMLNNNSIYFKIGIFELSLGYHQQGKGKLGWGVEADYRPAFNKSDSFSDERLNVSSSSAQEGYRVKALMHYQPSPLSCFSIFFSYRYLSADELIHDEGKFAGTNEARYDVYSQTNHESGLGFLYSKSIHEDPRLQWYIGGALLAKSVEKKYSIRGTYSSQTPYDAVMQEFYLHGALNVGITYKIIQF